MTENRAHSGSRNSKRVYPSRKAIQANRKAAQQARINAPDSRSHQPINPSQIPFTPVSPARAQSKFTRQSPTLRANPSSSSKPKKTKPKPTKPKPKTKSRKVRWLKRIFGTLLGTFLLGVIAFSILFVVAYTRLQIPQVQKFAEAQTTSVYWGDQKTLMGKFAERNRTIVDVSKFEHPYLANAVVASEDRTFYENVGVDFKGIARALWNNIQGKPRQGASTLTQQYVENYYTGKNTGYIGKFKESILALKINRQVDKNKILNDYLNTIYFGRGAYGIEAAAQAYFEKKADQLDLSESAMLAGIIPSPNSWDPEKNEAKAKERWKRVLNIMVEDKKITAAQRDQLQFPKTVKRKPATKYFQGTTGYLLQHVREELVKMVGYSPDEIDTAGIVIHTTIDPTRQKQLEEAVKTLPKDRPGNLRVAASAIDPKTGAVLAEYGGEDYTKVQRNAVTQDRAQAGSTFKPFTLLAALEKGKKVTDRINGNGPMKVNGALVGNFGGGSYGNMTLEQATRLSVNTAYVRLNQEVGMDTTRQVAIAAGYPKDTVGLEKKSVLGVLGTSSPHNLDIAQAYSTFASGGIKREAHIISKITDMEGKTIYEADTQGIREFQEDNIRELTKALHAVASPGGTGKEAAKLGRPVAAKTGSSQENRSAQFVGYIPQMVTAVTLYQVGEKGAEESITPFGGEKEVTGGTWPAKIWLSYMRNATKDLPVEPLLEEGKSTSYLEPKVKSTPYITATTPQPKTVPTRVQELRVPSAPSPSPTPSSSENSSDAVVPSPPAAQPGNQN